MGCASSVPYSQISPESQVIDDQALLISGSNKENDSFEWTSDVLAKPASARAKANATSPKEALALDLYLLSANIKVVKTLEPLPETDLLVASLCQYTLKDPDERKAGVVLGQGETFAAQRQHLLAALYREVAYRSATDNSGSSPEKTLSSNGPNPALATPQTKGFLSMLFRSSPISAVPAAGMGSHAPSAYVFSPPEAANVLQASQVQLDLLVGYRQAAEQMLLTQQSVSEKDNEEALTSVKSGASTGRGLMIVASPFRESPIPPALYSPGTYPNQNQLFPASSKPTSKLDFANGNSSSSSNSPVGRERGVSQLARASSFMLSNEETLVLTDLHLAQLRAMCLQYLQSLTSPALSQKQNTAQSPMSLALGAVRQTDALVTQVRTIGVELATGGLYVYGPTSPAAAKVHSLWIQCISQACRTIYSVSSLFLHHLQNTGAEYKYSNNKRALLSLISQVLPLLLQIVQNVAPSIALRSSNSYGGMRGVGLGSGGESPVSEPLPVRRYSIGNMNGNGVGTPQVITAVYVDAAIISLRRAYWSGCNVLLEVAHTCNICVGVIGVPGCGSGSSDSSGNGAVFKGKAIDAKVQPPSSSAPPRASIEVNGSSKNKSVRDILSLGRRIKENVQSALGLTSPVTQHARLIAFVNSLVLSSEEYLTSLAIYAYNSTDGSRSKSIKEKEEVNSGVDGIARALLRNEHIVRSATRTWGMLKPAASDYSLFTSELSDIHSSSTATTEEESNVNAGGSSSNHLPAPDSAAALACAHTLSSAVNALTLMIRAGTPGVRSSEIGLALLALLDSSAMSVLRPVGGDVLLNKHLWELAPVLAELLCATCASENAGTGVNSSKNSTNTNAMTSDVIFELAIRLAGFTGLLRGVLLQRMRHTSSSATAATATAAESVFEETGVLNNSSNNGIGRKRAVSIKTNATVGSSSGKSAAVPFAIGNKVDGLCSLKNGSQRWFSGLITSVTPPSGASGSFNGNGEEYTYTVTYDDGDIDVNKPAAEVRKTKKKTKRVVDISVTAEETGFTARALETLAVEQQEREKAAAALKEVSTSVVAAKVVADKKHVAAMVDEGTSTSTGALSMLIKSISPRPSNADATITNTAATITAASVDNASSLLQSLISPRTEIGSEDNEFFVIPSVFEDEDIDMRASRTGMSGISGTGTTGGGGAGGSFSKPMVPKMEFDMAVLSQSVQSMNSLSSFPVADGQATSTAGRSLGGSAMNTFRSTHLDSFRYPNRDRAESLDAVAFGASNVTTAMMGLSLPSVKSAIFSSLQVNAASRKGVHGEYSGHNNSRSGDSAGSEAETTGTSRCLPPEGEEPFPENLDASTLHSLLRTYSLLAAALLPHCVHSDRLHSAFTSSSTYHSMHNNANNDSSVNVNVMFAIREFFDVLHSTAEFGSGVDSELMQGQRGGGSDTSFTQAKQKSATATENMKFFFETAMLRCTQPRSAARRLMRLSGVSADNQPIPSIPCLVSHLSGNHSNNSNVSLGKGGFADVSLVICPVDCPCNPYKSRLDEYCSLLGVNTTQLEQDSNLSAYNHTLLDVAKQRLARKYAIKRLRREKSANEDPPAINNIFNEITCLEALRDASSVGVCRLFGYGVMDAEYLLAMEVGGKNLSEWRGELVPSLFADAVSDVLRRGHYNKTMSVGWPCSICIKSTVISSQLLPFETLAVDNDTTTPVSKHTVAPTLPTAQELDIIFSLLMLELYWDIVLIVQSIHKRDIAHFDLKCANFMFKLDATVEEEERGAQELRQRQLIQAEKEDMVRVAEQSAEAAILGTKLKAQFSYGATLNDKKEEVKTHCDAESERRARNAENLAVLKAKWKNGKNPKVKSAYTMDIDALELRMKTERATRKGQEEELAVMQKKYDTLKEEADLCEMRHAEANLRRASARKAARDALGVAAVDDEDDIAMQIRQTQQTQMRLLVSLLRSMPYMRACHLKGEASGLIILFDFGESVPHCSTWAPIYAGAYECRSRGTLPIQAPEFLSMTTTDSSFSSSATPLNLSTQNSISAMGSAPVSSRSLTPATATANATLNANVTGQTHAPHGKRVPVTFHEPNTAADVWSVGCLLPELVTGTYLFAERPWTDLYVSLCTVKSADCAVDGVMPYDIEGNIDTSAAPALDLPLQNTFNLLAGGKGGLFADRYASIEVPSVGDSVSAHVPEFASANLKTTCLSIESALRFALSRLPEDRPDAAGLAKLLHTALRGIAFSKGDVNGHHFSGDYMSTFSSFASKSAAAVSSSGKSSFQLPNKAPDAVLLTYADTVWTDANSSLTLSKRCLVDMLGLIDPCPLIGKASVSRLSSWIGQSFLRQQQYKDKILSKLHIICFTTRSAGEKGVKAAGHMLQDFTDLSSCTGTNSSSNLSSTSNAANADHSTHIHTAFPTHAPHEHGVVHLDTTDSLVMRQWSDMHEEWLHRFDVWEPADQACLDNPQEHIIDRGGEIVGIFVGGHLAVTVGFKPIGSTMNNKWELVKLAAHPAHSGQGLGKMLLRWTIDYLCAKTRKTGGAKCTIYLESNKKLAAAIGLYRAHGFLVIHERDLVAEAKARVLQEEMERVKREAEADRAAKNSWISPTTKSNATNLHITAGSDSIGRMCVSNAFPSPYETCDIIMERTINIASYKPLLSASANNNHNHNSSSDGGGGGGPEMLMSPRVAQSVTLTKDGGSVRFVHVDASAEGALEDVALAIQEIVTHANQQRQGSGSSNILSKPQFCVLVDPMPLPVPVLVQATNENDVMLEYDCLCVCGAAVLLEELSKAAAVAAGLTTVKKEEEDNHVSTDFRRWDGGGTAHAIVGSILPAPASASVASSASVATAIATAVPLVECVVLLQSLLHG